MIRQLEIPVLVIFPRAAREPEDNNQGGPLRYRSWSPMT